MTLMNAEPAEASPMRPWPNARGAASQSLLRAGIAAAAAGLFLFLICGLAHADASASLSVNVIPSGSPPKATCQLGNHGAVRGRAHVANGTLLADDGCLLRMSYPVEQQAFSPGSVSDYQNLVNNGHYNTVRFTVFIGCFYDD